MSIPEKRCTICHSRLYRRTLSELCRECYRARRKADRYLHAVENEVLFDVEDIGERIRLQREREQGSKRPAPAYVPPAPKPVVASTAFIPLPFLTVRWIAEAAAAIFNVDYAKLISPSRHHPVILPRFAVCLIAREQNRWSYPEIGRALGGRDHSTIIHAVRTAPIHARYNREYAAKVEALRQAVRDAFPQQVAA